MLGALYFVVICVQGALKYALNMMKGFAIETVAPRHSAQDHANG